jgi:hypothetical protein
MKILFVLLATLCSLNAQLNIGNPFYVVASLKPAAAGGSPAWYDIQSAAGANGTVAAAADQQLVASVTFEAGTCTKLRFSASGFAGNTGIKMGLFNSSDARLAVGSGTVTGNGDDQEITLDSSVVVTATTYKIYAVTDGNGFEFKLNNTTGTLNYLTTAGAYAAGVPATIPGGMNTIGWNICFGGYVE